MRLVFISLLIMNLAYFGWETWQKQQPNGANAIANGLPELKGATIRLLKERSKRAAGKQSNTKNIVSTGREIAAEVLPNKTMCVQIGPFSDRATGHDLQNLLEGEGWKVGLSRVELSREPQFWVLLPPAQSRRQAMESLRTLQTKKIDSYLISSGEMQNAISLGLFNQEQLAKGVLDQVEQAGFKAEIRSKERVENEYWVRILPDQPLENLEKTIIDSGSLGKDIKISKAACEMFAQTK